MEMQLHLMYRDALEVFIKGISLNLRPASHEVFW